MNKHILPVLKTLAEKYSEVEFFGVSALAWLGLVSGELRFYPMIRRDNPPRGRLFHPNGFPVLLMRDDITYVDPMDEYVKGVAANKESRTVEELDASFLFKKSLERFLLTDFWEFYTSETGVVTRECASTAIAQWRRCSIYDPHYWQNDTSNFTHLRNNHRAIQQASDSSKLLGRIASRFNIPPFKG